MDFQLKNQLKETVKQVRVSGVSTDGYAEPAYSTTVVSLTARVIGKQRYVMVGDQQVLSSKQFVSTGIVGERDRIWLPGDSTADQGWEVLMAQVCITETGSTDYYRAFLGR